MAKGGKLMAEIVSLDVVTIATNEYLEYWMNQARSIEHHWGSSLQLTLHVFTNRGSEALTFAQGLTGVEIKVHEIPGWGWPEASSYRYKIISLNRTELNSEYLMHLDADMLVVAPISKPDLLSPLRQGIVLVRHPGYYRPDGAARAFFYLMNPAKILFDLWTKLTLGDLGAWETDQRSQAAVPRKLRKEYFCGATWWGERDAIIQLCEELSQRSAIDETNKVEARWNDESHLNWWACYNEHGIGEPSFCFAKGYPQLRNITPKILALEKS
jgi:hypothetical protein